MTETDIVVTTCERLPLLQRTLEHIWERTTTPYRGGSRSNILAVKP